MRESDDNDDFTMIAMLSWVKINGCGLLVGSGAEALDAVPLTSGGPPIEW
jgi:hypothetical protein